MNILILHKVPFYKARYDESINHEVHNVFYLIDQENLLDVPSQLKATKIIKDKNLNIVDNVTSYILNNDIKFDRVISLSEYEIMEAAMLREKFNIAGATSDQIKQVRIKSVMKQSIINAHIRTADFMTLNDFFANPDQFFGKKVILKPVDGASSKDTHFYNSGSELFKQLRADSFVSKGDFNSYIVEEFIEGPIIHIDGIIQDGKVLRLVVSRYIGTCLEYANGKPLGSIQIDNIPGINYWTQKCINALDMRYGSFHLEAIMNESELYFLEIANRAGGAGVVDTFELATKINLYVEEVRLAMDPNIKIYQTYSKFKYGWFIFPGHNYSNNHCKVENTEGFISSPLMYKHYTSTRLIKHLTYRMNELPFSGIVCSNSATQNEQFINQVFNCVKIGHHADYNQQ